MSWFKNLDSGQVFEATGVWEGFARARNCIEIEAPKASVSTVLPEGFPARDNLVAAGLTGLEMLQGMTQTALERLPGVSRKEAKLIRSALKE